jgi:hypothetical protein
LRGTIGGRTIGGGREEGEREEGKKASVGRRRKEGSVGENRRG